MKVLKMDMHTHTVASGHAYSTIREMASAAAGKGLSLLGITEHAPSIPGTCTDMYYRNLRSVPRNGYDVELMLGSEINIIDYNGTLDLDADILRRLDHRIAGIHKYCYTPGSPEENTCAVVSAIKNPWVDIIAHPDDGKLQLDYEAIVKAAAENEVLLEINNNSMRPVMKRLKAFENNVEILRLCRKRGICVIIDSDAHIEFDIGSCDFAYKAIKEADFPEELIINNHIEEFKKLIRKRHAAAPDAKQQSFNK